MSWNGSNSGKAAAPRPPQKKGGGGVSPAVVKGAIGGLLVVVAAVLYFVFYGSETQHQAPGTKHKSSGTIKEVKPAPAAKYVEEKPKEPEWKRPDNWAQMSKAERREWLDENPQPRTNRYTMTVVSKIDRDKIKPVLEDRVQFELFQYTVPGQDVPPPFRISNEEALKACETPIKYDIDEPLDILERKKAVEEMLLELKDFIADGGSANEYLKEVSFRQSMEAEAVRQVRNDVRALVKEGKLDEARQTLDKYNEYLKSRNISEVRVKGLD